MTDQGLIWAYTQTMRPTDFAGAAPRLRYLARQAQRRSPNSVLTVGVGNGALEQALAGLGLSVVALDPIHGALVPLLRSAPGVTAIMQRLPFRPRCFDGLIVSEVLEHFDGEDGAAVLREAARVLRSDGWLLGTVPLKEKLEDEQILCPHCGYRGHPFGHRRAWNKPEFAGELKQHFRQVRLTIRAFPDFSRPGVTNRTKSSVRWAAGRLGLALSDPKIVFAAVGPRSLS